MVVDIVVVCVVLLVRDTALVIDCRVGFVFCVGLGLGFGVVVVEVLRVVDVDVDVVDVDVDVVVGTVTVIVVDCIVVGFSRSPEEESETRLSAERQSTFQLNTKQCPFTNH